MLLYAAIGAFGLLFLLLMLFVGDVFGGDHDVHVEAGIGDHDVGPSIFSTRIIGAFLTAFGVGGIVARYYGLSHPVSAGIGVVAGAVLATTRLPVRQDPLFAAGLERGPHGGSRRPDGRSDGRRFPKGESGRSP